MIPIHPNNLNEIVEEFYQAVKSFAISKRYYNTLNDWLATKGHCFEQVVKAKPSELNTLKVKIKNEGVPVEFKKIYSQFSNSSKGLRFANADGKIIVYSGIDLIEHLGITVCPYCNRTYVQSITNQNQYHKKRRTCEFDHFYPQSEYPFLAISFYNLIPSCKTCNHIKGKNPILFSPYEMNGESLVEFKYNIEGIDYLTDPKQLAIEIDWKNNKFYESNGKVFGLDDLYKNHNDIAQEILLKRHIYNDTRIDELWEEYKDLFSSKEEIIQMVTGNYINEEDLGKRPLAKLTRDIAREVKFIK